MSGAVVQDEDWDKLEHSGRFNSVMSYPFWKNKGHSSEDHLPDLKTEKSASSF